MKMKILASTLVGSVCRFVCLCLQVTQFKSNLHQTLNTGRYQSGENWLNSGIHLALDSDPGHF